MKLFKKLGALAFGVILSLSTSLAYAQPWGSGGTASNPSFTGQVSINDEILLTDGTDTHSIKAVQEPGSGGRVTLGLDGSSHYFAICDIDHIDNDLGLIASADPRLVLFDRTGLYSVDIRYNLLTSFATDFYFIVGQELEFRVKDNSAAGDSYTFKTQDADDYLTDTDGEQSFVYIEPKLNQSGTAAYNGLKVVATETALGDGSTGTNATNNLLALGTSAIEDLFVVENDGGLWLGDGTDESKIQMVTEAGLGGRLTMGLDETTRMLVICDIGDIDVDLGLGAQGHPSISIFNAGVTQSSRYRFDQTGTTSTYAFRLLTDIDSANFFEVDSSAGIQLTDTDAEQAWMYIEPKINQSATANYIGLLMDVTETGTGSGTNELMALRVSGSDKFTVGNTGDVIVAGTISGNSPVTLHTDATESLTAAQCQNQYHYNNDADAIDFTLPGAAAGLTVCFYDIAGGVITVDPVDGTDTIYLDGTSVGAGDAIDSPGAVGDFICLQAIDATRWVTWGRSGTWVDGGVD